MDSCTKPDSRMRAQTMRISTCRRHSRSRKGMGLPPVRCLSSEFESTLYHNHNGKSLARDGTASVLPQSRVSSPPKKRSSTMPRSSGLPPQSPSHVPRSGTRSHRRAHSQSVHICSTHARTKTLPRRRRGSFNTGLPPPPMLDFKRELVTSFVSGRRPSCSQTKVNLFGSKGRRNSGLPAPPASHNKPLPQPFIATVSVSHKDLRTDSLISTASSASDALRADSLLSNASSYVGSDSLLSNASSTASVYSQGGKRLKVRFLITQRFVFLIICVLYSTLASYSVYFAFRI